MAPLGGFYGGLAKRAVKKRAEGDKRGLSSYRPEMGDLAEMLNPPKHSMVTDAGERERERGYRQYFGKDFGKFFRKATRP